jgi:hypothetical protein
MPIPARLDPNRHQECLYICRLQSLPTYREILRRLTQGQSVRSLALWLAKQRYDGPSGAWTWTYWQKLLVPLAREVAKTKALQEAADRRKASHPAPSKPEQIAQIVAETLDPRMELLNVMDDGTKKVYKHVQETRDQIHAEDGIKLLFLRQVHRLDKLITMEDKLNILLPSGSQEVTALLKTLEAMLKLEVIQGKHLPKASDSSSPANAEPGTIAYKMSKFGVVDRNLIRSAADKVIQLIQEEADAMRQASELDADASRETRAADPEVTP